jgi:hypothetical protein
MTLQIATKKTQEQIIAEANKAIAMGSKMTFEAIVAMLEKKNNQFDSKAKKTVKKFAVAESIKGLPSVYGDMTIAEINEFNAKNNLPSSLR